MERKIAIRSSKRADSAIVEVLGSVCNKMGSPLDHDSAQAWSSWRAETGSAQTENGLNRG